MRALTVHQPWAELIACGAKKIETRSWHTWDRGPLAIHASLNKQVWNRVAESCGKEMTEIYKVIKPGNWEKLEFGAIIAVCNLVDVIGPIPITMRPVTRHYTATLPDGRHWPYTVTIPPQEPELFFGEYAPGQYAWILEDVQRLPEPIPAKGRQRLWETDPEVVSAAWRELSGERR